MVELALWLSHGLSVGETSASGVWYSESVEIILVVKGSPLVVVVVLLLQLYQWAFHLSMGYNVYWV